MVRRTTSSLLAFLLLLLVGIGGIAPATWAWQCHHSTQLVEMPFAAPDAMPCQSAAGQAVSKTMPCCHIHPRIAGGSSAGKQILAASRCKPAFTQLAGLSPVTLSQSSRSIDAGIAGIDDGFLPLLNRFLIKTTTVTQRQRPPPAADIPASNLLRTPSLRGPPTA